ncbi:MAG: tetratricopeptide repeat protein [Clostridiaceae bacterium]
MNNNIIKKLDSVYVFHMIGIIVAFLIMLNLINYKENHEIKYSIDTAEKYYYSGQFELTLDEYKNLYLKDKLNPLWDIKIAEVYSFMGDIEQADEYLDKAKSSNFITGDDVSYVIFTEFSNKEYEQALKDGEQALKDYPDNIKIYKTMFAVYMVNEDIDNATNILKKYPIDRTSAYDIAEYAQMLIISGDWDQGLNELLNAWNIDKDEYKIYDVLSQISLFNMDELLQKISALQQEDEENLAYKMWLAKVYSTNVDTSAQAQSLIEELSTADVGDLEIKIINSTVLSNLDEDEEANKILNEIINNNGDYRVYHTAAWYYYNKGEYDKALEYCKKSIEENEDYPDNYGFLMPAILKASEDTSNIEAYFMQALRLEPYNYNMMLNTANYYYEKNNISKTLEYYGLAELIKPDDASIKYDLAIIYLNNGDTDKTIEKLNDCIKIAEDVSKYHRTLGTLLMTLGKTKEGMDEIRIAFNADQSDILNLNNAGVYYISVEKNIERGLYNIEEAYNNLNDSYPEYIKTGIAENYKKAKKLVVDFVNSEGDEKLEIPDFTLFY